MDGFRLWESELKPFVVLQRLCDKAGVNYDAIKAKKSRRNADLSADELTRICSGIDDLKAHLGTVQESLRRIAEKQLHNPEEAQLL